MPVKLHLIVLVVRSANEKPIAVAEELNHTVNLAARRGAANEFTARVGDSENHISEQAADGAGKAALAFGRVLAVDSGGGGDGFARFEVCGRLGLRWGC